ncbi:reverse transcriptase domain-containing protein [Tanacetum coccineum]
MIGPTPDQTTPDQSLNLQDQILNHISLLEALIKQHNEKAETLITHIRLTFGEEGDSSKGQDKGKGLMEEAGDDLKKPYKEVLKSPFTRRIIKFSASSHRMPTNLRIYSGSIDPDDHITRFVRAANQGEWEIPVWCRMFQQTLDGPAKGWFDRFPNCGIDSWADLREKFIERFALRRRCSKDSTEVSKIVRRANETLSSFKERWTGEIGYIQGGRYLHHENDEASRRFCQIRGSLQGHRTAQGEHLEKGQGTPYKGSRPPRIMQSGGPPKVDGYNTYNRRDHYQPLESLVKRPKEILATELQLQLPPPPSLIGAPKRENLDKYYDYHRKKGHYTNDCFQLKRQRGGNQGKQTGNSSANGKIINMVYEMGDSQKRKFHKRREEDWMNVPITFPPIPSNDVSDEPLIIEAEVEGYLVRRVFVDQGAAVQGVSGVLERTVTSDGKNQIGSYVWERRLEPKNGDEIHDSTSVISIKHHPRTNGNERNLRHLVHHSCNDEISYPEGNSHIGSLEGYDLRMQETRRQTYFVRRAT